MLDDVRFFFFQIEQRKEWCGAPDRQVKQGPGETGTEALVMEARMAVLKEIQSSEDRWNGVRSKTNQMLADPVYVIILDSDGVIPGIIMHPADVSNPTRRCLP